jgi:hypothetical protein
LLFNVLLDQTLAGPPARLVEWEVALDAQLVEDHPGEFAGLARPFLLSLV